MGIVLGNSALLREVIDPGRPESKKKVPFMQFFRVFGYTCPTCEIHAYIHVPNTKKQGAFPCVNEYRINTIEGLFFRFTVPGKGAFQKHIQFKLPCGAFNYNINPII